MADKGKLDVITRLNKCLSKRGKGKNKKENQRRSPPSDLLLEAARIGHVEAVKTLLEAGADNRVLTRGVTHPRRPATRGLFLNPTRVMTRVHSEIGALTRVKSASTDVERARMGNTFSGSGTGEEGRKRRKAG